MVTKPRLASSFLFACLALLSTGTAVLTAAGAPADARVAASFLLARGRLPSGPELASWTSPEPFSFADLLTRHREELTRDATLQRDVAERAWRDAFGRMSGVDTTSEEADGGLTYTHLMQRHVRQLSTDASAYVEVIHRAYRLVVRRDAYPEELDYWKRPGALPFVVLVGCVEDWARRNQPGLMVTTGTATLAVNSDYLATVMLSSVLAAEARAAAGLLPVGDAARASAAGRNLIAAGGAGVVTGGHLHLVVAGSPHLTENLQP